MYCLTSAILLLSAVTAQSVQPFMSTLSNINGSYAAPALAPGLKGSTTCSTAGTLFTMSGYGFNGVYPASSATVSSPACPTAGDVPTITEVTFYSTSTTLQYVFVEFDCQTLLNDINAESSFQYVTQLSMSGGYYYTGNSQETNCFTSTANIVLTNDPQGTWCLGLVNLASTSITVNAAVAQTCNPYYSYSTGTWSSCTSGQATQTRTVNCVNPTGTTQPSSNCVGLTEPVTSQPCVFEWVSGSWSTCTSSTQTRTVTCEDGGQNTVPNQYCAAQTQPTTQQTCTVSADNSVHATSDAAQYSGSMFVVAGVAAAVIAIIA